MMNGGPKCLARENQFFKVLVDDFTEKLSIPKAFIEKMPEGLSGTVILHGPSGNCWPVRLSRTSKGTYLAGGWEAFVKHHSLTEGEFLVFNRVRSMHFDVKIFGKNACERGDAFTVQAALGLTCRQLKGKTQSPKGDEDNMSSISKGTFKLSGERAKREARHFTSKFPYFMNKVKKYNLTQFHLTIPIVFAIKHLRERKELVLQNEKGEWSVNLNGHRQILITGSGWREFAGKNQLKEGDCCVFELIEEGLMQVHIYRC